MLSLTLPFTLSLSLSLSLARTQTQTQAQAQAQLFNTKHSKFNGLLRCIVRYDGSGDFNNFISHLHVTEQLKYFNTLMSLRLYESLTM
jgi:hypothetical protein